MQPGGDLPRVRQPQNNRKAYPVQTAGIARSARKSRLNPVRRFGCSQSPILSILSRIPYAGREAGIENAKLSRRRVLLKIEQPRQGPFVGRPSMRRIHRILSIGRRQAQGMEQPLTLMKSGRIGQELEAAWIPPDGVLGAQSKSCTYLTLVDRVVGQGSQQQGVGKPSWRDAIDYQVPPAIARLPRNDGHDTENPPLAYFGLPFLACAHFSRHHDFFAVAHRHGAGVTGDRRKRQRGQRAKLFPEPNPSPRSHRPLFPNSQFQPFSPSHWLRVRSNSAGRGWHPSPLRYDRKFLNHRAAISPAVCGPKGHKRVYALATLRPPATTRGC
jgi:hypothetical protein